MSAAPRRVLFLGGNGHCAARLADARTIAGRLGLVLEDAPYPGFEGRPRARTFEAFLDALDAWLQPAALVYATGIGGLLALCLRARGRLRETPLLFQAPVLWGLERRLMPRVMRLPAARFFVRPLFASRAFQGRFVRRHFTRALSAHERQAFFDGYAACTALPDLFAWLKPALLRRLESRLARDAHAKADIRIWWGGCDSVVTPEEAWWTERALGVVWPLRIFREWGHYPMIDSPLVWTETVLAHVDEREPASAASPR